MSPSSSAGNYLLEPTDADLAELESNYLTSRYCDLYQFCQQRWKPMIEWRGTAQRVFASRVLENLGDSKTARAMVWSAYHDDRQHPTAQDAWSRIVIGRRGPYEALQLITPPRSEWSADHRGHRHLTRAEMLSYLRDFRRADAELTSAQEALGDRHGWYWTVKSYALRSAEKHREALQMAERGLEHAPYYRPLILAATTQLLRLGETAAGAKLLQGIMPVVQSPALGWHLALVELELGHFDNFHEALALTRQWAIRADPAFQSGLLLLEMEAWYRLGDDLKIRELIERLAALPETADYVQPWQTALERSGRRVELPVPRVPQEHMTCGPATLASIAGFHREDVDHNAIAREICYQGTPAWRERAWAEGRGWVTREFTVTWDAVVSLIDAGLPFTLTLASSTSSHLQAVVGFDERRKQLLIRDPSSWNLRQLDWSWIEQHQTVCGPRGMAVAPPSHAHLLRELALPDAEHWDRLHAIDKAGEHGRRDAMAAATESLAADAPDHRLTLEARLRLAYFDQDWARAWVINEAYQARFPDNDLLIPQHLHLLRMNGRSAHWRDYLAEQMKRPRPLPIIIDQWAQLVREDPRQQRFALSLARRSVAQNWINGVGYAVMGDCQEALGLLEDAAFSQDIALRLSPGNQGIVRSYFRVMSALGRREEALRKLHEDVETAAGLASDPALVLGELLESIGRIDAAMRVLEQAAERRPHDAAVAMARARRLVRAGQNDEAQALMTAIRERSSPLDWHDQAGDIADWAGDRPGALAHWRNCLAGDPRRIEVQRRYARALAEQDGIDAAIAHLRRTIESHPDDALLSLLLAEWLRHHPDQALAWARQQAMARPYDPWWQRELGLLLLRNDERDEAARAIQASVTLDPRHPASWATLGEIRRVQGQSVAADEAFRTALTLSIDHRPALEGLLAITPSENRREVLAFARGELQRQVVSGEGISAYVDCARGVLTPEELLEHVREAHAARPDLIFAWTTLIEQLLAAGKPDDAHQLAIRCTERFPLLPHAWHERATTALAIGHSEEERRCLEQACTLAPWLSFPARNLADHLRRSGDQAGRRQVLERIVRADPLDTVNLGWLAELEWEEGHHDLALTQVERCCREHPGYDWAWSVLGWWGSQRGKPKAALTLARQLAEERRSSPERWERLARCCMQAEDFASALEATARLLAINPHHLAAHQVRIQAFACLGREADALSACQPAVFANKPPSLLRLERAKLLARSGLPAAIAELQAVVRSDPGFLPAHHQLLDWQHAAKDKSGYLASAKVLVAQAPGDARSWGYLAQALDDVEGKTSAIESLQRALRLDPHYFYAAFQLCRIALRERQVSLASDTLEQVRRYTRDAGISLLAASIAAARNQESEFERAVEEFLGHSGTSLATLEELRQLVALAGSRWTMLLKDQIDRRGHLSTVPAVQVHWVEAQVKQRRMARVRHHLGTLGHDHPAFVPATAVFLDHLAQARAVDELVHTRKLLESKLMANTLLWGKTGYALITCDLMAQARLWLESWRQHPQAEPWMLYNLQFLLREDGRRQEALQVIETALQQPPDQTTPELQVFAAIEYALTGQPGRAQPLVIQARAAIVDAQPQQNFWLAAAEAILVAAQADGPDSWRQIARACVPLAEALKKLRRHQSGLSQTQQREWERMVRHLARRGGWRGWWWAFRQGFWVAPW